VTLESASIRRWAIHIVSEEHAAGTRVASSADGPDAREWFPGIEALRGIAAMAVVVDHSWALANGSQSFGLGIVPGLGTWGVNVFFLLSGFLLADYFWAGRGRRSVLEYYVRRFFRIAPAYYVVVGFLFVFFADHTLLFSHIGLRQVFANLTFTQWLTPDTSSNLNIDGSLWTLTIEMMLYAVMPFLAFLISRRPILASLVVGGIGVGFRLYDSLGPGTLERWAFGAKSGVSPEIQHLFIARQFLGIIPIFVLGMATRWAVLHGRLGRWATAPLRRPSVLVLAVLLVPSLVLLREVQRASVYTHWIWFSGFDLLVCLLAVPAILYGARPVRGQLGPPMRVSVWLGERSYGLYLWHFPVILSIYGMGPSTHPPQLSYLPLRLAGIVLISVALAAGSYRFVEHPGRELGRQLGRRLRRRRHTAMVGVPVTGEAA
jgi:peptidoglycan/LPS O-acetylase OafA/YrhL